jgi:hypothetical protein
MTRRGMSWRSMLCTGVVWACCAAALLAACAPVDGAKPKTPTPSRPQPAVPAQPGPTCRVDADCAVDTHCTALPGGCRCANGHCLAPRAAVDPVIDPAPAPPASVR